MTENHRLYEYWCKTQISFHELISAEKKENHKQSFSLMIIFEKWFTRFKDIKYIFSWLILFMNMILIHNILITEKHTEMDVFEVFDDE